MRSCFPWPKDYRLRKTSHYQYVQKKGAQWRSKHLIVLFVPGQQTNSRIGITVSKKVGNAVVRNRVKRKIREGIRQEYTNLTNLCDIVIIAKKSAAIANTRTIQNEIVRSFQYISKKYQCSKKC